MKAFLFLLATIGVAVAVPQTKIHEEWTKFKTTHLKQYSSELEELKRFVIFMENSIKIEAHNRRYVNGEVTYYKKMNKFGDLTVDEFLSFVNSTKPKTPRKFLRTHIPSLQPIDADVDWRTKNVLSEVKNEGTCSSSWSFSATGALEAQLSIKNGQTTSLSEQNLIDCSGDYGNSGCDGGFADGAFDYIRDNGIMSESDYPFEGQQGSCRFDGSRSVTKISGYVNVDFMSETNMADAVANVGPVAAAVDATEELRFYYGGIFFDDTCNINESDLNHGVLVVGYGRELQYDYWIVKNSWGVDWGENGYYQSIRNYGNNCGIATHASYPQL